MHKFKVLFMHNPFVGSCIGKKVKIIKKKEETNFPIVSAPFHVYIRHSIPAKA